MCFIVQQTELKNAVLWPRGGCFSDLLGIFESHSGLFCCSFLFLTTQRLERLFEWDGDTEVLVQITQLHSFIRTQLYRRRDQTFGLPVHLIIYLCLSVIDLILWAMTLKALMGQTSWGMKHLTQSCLQSIIEMPLKYFYFLKREKNL